MTYSVKVVLLVLTFSLVSGGAGYYLGTLSNSANTNSKQAKSTLPQKTGTASPSPAGSPATSSAGFNPFSSATQSATTNPFDTSSTYENPFKKVQGAATGYVNPFDEFVKNPRTR